MVSSGERTCSCQKLIRTTQALRGWRARQNLDASVANKRQEQPLSVEANLLVFCTGPSRALYWRRL